MLHSGTLVQPFSYRTRPQDSLLSHSYSTFVATYIKRVHLRTTGLDTLLQRSVMTCSLLPIAYIIWSSSEKEW